MDNFLARCSVLAIIGGGFVATGDLADVVSRGRHLVEAVDVPSVPADTGAVSAGAPAPPPGVTPRTTPQPSPADAPEAPQAAPLPASAPPDDGRQPVDQRPPANGLDRIDITGLQAGDRITVWLRNAAIGSPLRLVCDVIDPTAGEVLVNGGTAGPHARGTLLTGNGRPTNALVRGAAVRLQRIGPARTPSTDLLVEGTIDALARGD